MLCFVILKCFVRLMGSSVPLALIFTLCPSDPTFPWSVALLSRASLFIVHKVPSIPWLIYFDNRAGVTAYVGLTKLLKTPVSFGPPSSRCTPSFPQCAVFQVYSKTSLRPSPSSRSSILSRSLARPLSPSNPFPHPKPTQKESTYRSEL